MKSSGDMEKNLRALLESQTTALGLQNGSFVPQYTQTQHVQFSNIKKQILKCFQSDAYEELKKDFFSYGLNAKDFSEFFSQFGNSIIDWAVSIEPSAKSLAFLKENIPIKYIKDELIKNECNILKSFISCQIGLKEFHKFDRNCENYFIDKLNILLEIIPEEVKEFMKSSYVENKIKSYDDIINICNKTLSGHNAHKFPNNNNNNMST